ncbi:hypothetical protein NDU88_003622 [Pleurodeles waltl]|uniref:Uncharacterized protein n=1 Tax=Pleurodeles waltl TaxID=8319 RepID=A0AAV7V2Y9_PLEWA|nr:hypothetical protein NDU88_003622 [Pleurodeles waltl]
MVRLHARRCVPFATRSLQSSENNVGPSLVPVEDLADQKSDTWAKGGKYVPDAKQTQQIQNTAWSRSGFLAG